MKCLKIVKTVSLFSLMLAGIAGTVLCGHAKREQTHKMAKSSKEDAILKDASKRIKSNLKNNSGKISSMCFTYNVCGSKTLSTNTKVYYDNYRKKPDFKEEIYSAKKDIQADKVFQVKYDKHSDIVSLIYKNPTNKSQHICVKEIDFSQLQAI